MSKIFPKELVDALGLIHDISVGLVSEDVYLFRGTVEVNDFDEEVPIYGSAEVIDIFIKYPKLPRIHPGVFYDEEELPIIARIKNEDDVKQHDIVVVEVQGLRRTTEWKKYKVMDVLAKVVTNMEVYAEYKLAPDRAVRDFWITKDCISEDFDSLLSTNWDIINADYSFDTDVKHSGIRSIDGGATGALLQSKVSYNGLSFNVWILLEGTGYYITNFRYKDANNYYTLKCELAGTFLKYTLSKVVASVVTVLKTATTDVDATAWVNVAVESVYECNIDTVVNRIYFTDVTHTIQHIENTEASYPTGADEDNKFQIGVVDSHMDGEMVMCNLFHIE